MVRLFFYMTYSAKISGKVQGVFFRYHTHLNATTLGISGFVKNLDDGSVYTEFWSDDEVNLNKFKDWLHRGSPSSKVKEIEFKRVPKIEGSDGFVIHR